MTSLLQARAYLWAAAVGFVALLILAPLTAQAAPPVDVYGHLPKLSHVVISPDGSRIAQIEGTGRFGVVAMYDTSALTAPPVIFKAEDWMMPRSLRWANNQRLLVTMHYALKGAKGVGFYPYVMSRTISIDRNGGDAKVLLSDKREFRSAHASGAVLECPDAGTSPNVLMLAQTEHVMDFTLDIFSVDAATGKFQKLEEGKPETIAWTTDGHGHAVVRTDWEKGTTRIYARPPGTQDWTEVYHFTEEEEAARGMDVLGHSANPDEVYVQSRAGAEHENIYALNLRTKALTPVLGADAHVDITDAIVDPATASLWGARFDWDRPRRQFFDTAGGALYATVGAKFPGDDVTIVSTTSEHDRVIAAVEGPANPGGAYYLVDAKSGQSTKLGAKYPELTRADRANTNFFTYQSRDGKTIPAYLVLPAGATPGKLPLVVMPHGGPAARDTADFDFISQFFATRGYTVFEPQFRGSEGFGRDFQEAGKFQWGLAMQDDITDGVQKLVADGKVDPARICIFGASYGGYAALVGAMQSPQPYRCAVSLSGLFELRLMLLERFYYATRGYTDYFYWRSIIGDTRTDGDRLDRTSPGLQADKITVPVLLLHGTNDLTVAVVHSQLMAKALKDAGKEYSYIELPGEDHYLSQNETRLQILREVDAFLAKYLKP